MDHWLIVLQDGAERRFRLDRPSSLIGQSADCDLRLAHPTVSRRHARIDRCGDGFLLVDLGSTNGSFVDGVRIEEARIGSGQPLRFGELSARIEARARGELAISVDLPTPASGDASARTQIGGASARFLLGELPRLLRQLRERASVGELARAAVAAMHRAYPGLSLGIELAQAGGAALIAGSADADAQHAQDTIHLAPFAFRWRREAAPAELGSIVELVAELLRVAQREEIEATATVEPATRVQLPGPASCDERVLSIYRTAARVAPARDIHVLIEGESGTGKELLANFLHEASGASGPMVAINCAALPRDLLEAELFGIERGVATGVEARAGRFELADGGTLFLDEIGEMSADVQAKLLRVLQEGQVLRLGARAPRRIDVRIVAATNRDLQQQVERGEFRLDLYHRIADWSVRLPALRERPADLLTLAAHFLERECRKRALASVGLSRDAAQALRAFDWPGNVRELEREMRRAALFLENGQVLDASMLSERVRAASESGGGRESALDESALREAIAAARGNMSAAAQRLGVARSTLYRRMKTLGMDSPGE